MTRPVFTLIAGANGAGKSTLSSYGREALGHIPVLDPDLIATVIKSDTKGVSAIGAGREVLNAAATHMVKRRSFAIETTLAGQLYLNMMARTHRLGYENILIYIGTASVEINLSRIAERVRSGGHDVPEEDVRRRYVRSLRNLPIAITRSDRAILFDNSDLTGYEIIGIVENGSTDWLQDVPAWAAVLR